MSRAIDLSSKEGEAYVTNLKTLAEAEKLKAETEALKAPESKFKKFMNGVKETLEVLAPLATVGVTVWSIRRKEKAEDKKLGAVLAIENTGHLPSESSKALVDAFNSTSKEIDRLRK